MATVTRKGNLYFVTAEEDEVFTLDRPVKKVNLQGKTISFPSLFGYPISFTGDFFGSAFYVEEYGEFANENYWDSVEIPQS